MPLSKSSRDQILRRAERVTEAEWKDKLRPIFEQTITDIVSKVQNVDPNSFQLHNLKTILGNVQGVVDDFAEKFGVGLSAAQQRAASLAEDHLSEVAERSGISLVATHGLAPDLAAAIVPVSQAAVEFFASDMSKVIGTEISIGMVQGKSTYEVAKAIQDRFESSMMSLGRAETIARTELASAYNYAQQFRAQDVASRVPTARKAWISTHRPDARQNHIELEEQTNERPIPIDEEFVIPPDPEKGIPSETCMFPADPTLSPANRISCACISVIVDAADYPELAEEEGA